MNSSKRRYDFLFINTLRKPQVFHCDTKKKEEQKEEEMRWTWGLDWSVYQSNAGPKRWLRLGETTFFPDSTMKVSDKTPMGLGLPVTPPFLFLF